jgi:hypothetical protein
MDHIGIAVHFFSCDLVSGDGKLIYLRSLGLAAYLIMHVRMI